MVYEEALKMAGNPESVASSLLCAESTQTCFDDPDSSATDEFSISPSWSHHLSNNLTPDPFFNINRFNRFICFAIPGEEIVRSLVHREKDHLPRYDYLGRLRSGDLDMSVRRDALDWILKAKSHYNFGPLSVCLAMNYLDRFLSLYTLPKGKAWTVQLLAVGCLSLAVKMEETKLPLLVDLQVGEPKFMFEAKTIQRMELLVLSTLNWRMRAVTPCSFIDYFLNIIIDDQKQLSKPFISRSVQLILSTIRGIDFLEFRPSEIAAAVAISTTGEVQGVDIDKAMPGFMHVEKDRVLKCIELIKDWSLCCKRSTATAAANVASASGSSKPHSPIGVLDAACLSYKSDDTTVGSCANSPPPPPPPPPPNNNNNNNIASHQDIKRRKQDNNNNQPFPPSSSLEEPES